METLSSTRRHVGAAGRRAVVISKRVLGMLQLVVAVALMTSVVVGVMGDDSEPVQVDMPRLMQKQLLKELGDTPDVNGLGWTEKRRAAMKELAKEGRKAERTLKISIPLALASLAAGGLSKYFSSQERTEAPQLVMHGKDAQIVENRSEADLKLLGPQTKFATKAKVLGALAVAGLLASLAVATKAVIDRKKVGKKFGELAKAVKRHREEGEDISAFSDEDPFLSWSATKDAAEEATADEVVAEALSGAEK